VYEWYNAGCWVEQSLTFQEAEATLNQYKQTKTSEELKKLIGRILCCFSDMEGTLYDGWWKEYGVSEDEHALAISLLEVEEQLQTN